MDYDTSAYYDASGNEGNNHMVTVVGWDDSYKKENFNSSGSSWLKTPEHDGAWIVQNSYSQDWGDNGYFYISYDDKSLYNAICRFVKHMLHHQVRNHLKQFEEISIPAGA